MWRGIRYTISTPHNFTEIVLGALVQGLLLAAPNVNSMHKPTLSTPESIVGSYNSVFYKTSGDTTRNFRVYRLYEHCFSVTKFTFERDLSLTVSFNVYDIEDFISKGLIQITGHEYDKLIDVYESHVEAMLLKSREILVKCPHLELTNPMWRANQLKREKVYH